MPLPSPMPGLAWAVGRRPRRQRHQWRKGRSKRSGLDRMIKHAGRAKFDGSCPVPWSAWPLAGGPDQQAAYSGKRQRRFVTAPPDDRHHCVAVRMFFHVVGRFRRVKPHAPRPGPSEPDVARLAQPVRDRAVGQQKQGARGQLRRPSKLMRHCARFSRRSSGWPQRARGHAREAARVPVAAPVSRSGSSGNGVAMLLAQEDRPHLVLILAAASGRRSREALRCLRRVRNERSEHSAQIYDKGRDLNWWG